MTYALRFPAGRPARASREMRSPGAEALSEEHFDGTVETVP